ncbi:MAG: hypothetical protein H6725_07390 [Sandaracinaceae bacterium]|nr:hypothetical protein [Sandaracinaceae bacterium]
MRAPRFLLLCSLLHLVSGCGGGAPPVTVEDAGVPSDNMCERNLDCDDGLFCNGAERCAPANSSADERGCVVAEAPCLQGQTCIEASLSCRTTCSETEDADDDGHRAMVCGGDDCDDSDSGRFPGNTEVCDVDDRDEDCDPSTYGFRDLDGDGVGDAACCNAGTDGEPNCGRDCDDAAPGVSPTGTEVCDGLDNDCDGTLDEGVFATFYRDADGDGFGDPTVPVAHACTEAHSDALNGFDCDDTDDTVRPGAAELCDGVDNNCDGLFERDLDHDGHLDPSSVCAGGTAPLDDCNDFRADTYAGAPELCDRVDNDCDGRIDERVDADATCSTNQVDAGFCISGSCEVALCEAGAGDCNNNALDGCETDLSSNSLHCGSCGTACPLGETCTAGLCAVPTATSLSVGEGHACVVTSSGAIGCWGENSDGQLGAGTSEMRAYASHSSRFGESSAVAVSAATTCAVATDGRVFCDGSSLYGARGVSVAANYAVVTEVLGLTQAQSIRGGSRSFCATREDGGVWCWGWGPALFDSRVPVQITSGASSLDVGWDSLCGYGGPVSGVWCLGSDVFGQLGNNDPLPLCTWREPTLPVSGEDPCSSTPLAVDPSHAHPLVAVGESFACSTDGQSIACWGDNSDGQGLVTPPSVIEQPLALGLQPPGSPALTALSAGRDHVCALRADGSVVCWGANDQGQLGRGTTGSYGGVGSANSPARFASIDAGGDTTCAIDEVGQPWCWGRNAQGQLGDRTTDSRDIPTAVTGFDTARAPVRGAPCAVLRSGALRCWGDGDPTASPVTETDQNHQVTSGARHTCALRGDGEVWCWGWNEFGQLGNESIANGVFPASRVTLPPTTSLSANANTTCAVLTSGEVRCWGQNRNGQLGLDTTITAGGVPTGIAGLDDALSVSVGDTHVCALRRTGGVVCWGAGGAGQLGNGLGADSLTPVAVSSLSDVVQVEAGHDVSCARRVGGSVYCWGTGTNGQLGAGANRTFSPTPIQVRDVRNATALHLVSQTACIVDDLAEVYCWGHNVAGQAGADAFTTERLFLAARVPGVLATRIGGSPSTTCAVGLDDAVRCWGDSYDGDAGVVITVCNSTCTPGGGCSATCPAPPTVVRGL